MIFLENKEHIGNNKYFSFVNLQHMQYFPFVNLQHYAKITRAKYVLLKVQKIQKHDFLFLIHTVEPCKKTS